MTDCIFCKIIAGELPCAKVREDEHFLAFLDLYPNRPGMTLVIPKTHQSSDILSLSDDQASALFLAAKQVSVKLKKAMNAERIGVVMAGLEVAHAHIKLYPFTESHNGFRQGIDNGKQADPAALEVLAKKIQNS